MGEGDLLLCDRIDQRAGHIATGVDLLHAKAGRDIWQAPGVYVKHWGDRHIDVSDGETAVTCPSERLLRRHGMQHELTMAEIHTLGQAGRARGIEGRRPRVLVQLGEIEIRISGGQQRFMLAFQR
jgi:hypothetical protein